MLIFAPPIPIGAIAGFARGAAFERGSEGPAAPASQERNDDGLTYGPSDEGGTQPDLYAITAVDGEEGYAYSLQAFGQTLLSPEEAEACPRKTKEVLVDLSDGSRRSGTP